MKCPNCGGTLVGDGFRTPIHCEFAYYPIDAEPDGKAFYCGLDKEVVESLHNWLGSSGRRFFRTLAKLYKGDVIPVLRLNYIRKHVPAHSVHLREGMQIRNYLRSLPNTKGWSFDQFENDYHLYIKAAMKEK